MLSLLSKNNQGNVKMLPFPVENFALVENVKRIQWDSVKNVRNAKKHA